MKCSVDDVIRTFIAGFIIGGFIVAALMVFAR